MKAILTKVNYDPRYTHPNNVKPHHPLHSRLTLAKEIYSPERRFLRDSLEEAARRRLKLRQQQQQALLASAEGRFHHSQGHEPLKQRLSVDSALSDYSEAPGRRVNGVRLDPIDDDDELNKNNQNKDKPTESSPQERQKRITMSSHMAAPATMSSYITPTVTLKNQRVTEVQSAYLGKTGSLTLGGRSSTLPEYASVNIRRAVVKSASLLELERKAKVEADKAVKNKKVFTIVGPYWNLRKALRRRGWVEKFTNAPHPDDIPHQSADKKTADNSPPGDPGCDNTKPQSASSQPSQEKVHKDKPWLEGNGYYGLVSYYIKNAIPSFLFTLRCNDVDNRSLRNTQIVNHFDKAKNITTKMLLCQNLHNVPWYSSDNPDTFYPRTYRLDIEEERNEFIEDFRYSAVFGFLKHYVLNYTGPPDDGTTLGGSMAGSKADPDDSTQKKTGSKPESASESVKSSRTPRGKDEQILIQGTAALNKKSPLTDHALEVACEQCRGYLYKKLHEDIDARNDPFAMKEAAWCEFLSWYYQFVHDDEPMPKTPVEMFDTVRDLLAQLEKIHPQYQLDGIKNIWILKPGAKSRGRGIELGNKLGACLSAAEKENGAMVVQKYIETPLLIYRTKFDIRQWFLVTDWNPLTLWFYKDCYLRFCSQPFSLDDFHEAIHLSNNSIQKNYEVGSLRSTLLPKDNMWTSDEFKDYLRMQGREEVWFETILPGMKRAILCSLECSQEHIENRKNAFEIYGADFMLTDDFQPWLIEINSSPSMSTSTKATSRLVEQLFEDTCKVIVDRRLDKNASTGQFELIYQQKYISDPPPTDFSLAVTGKKIPRKGNK